MNLFNGQKILVVEDNFMSFKLIEAHFRRVNLSILHAPDGLSALSVFKSDPDIDLVIMDIQLPGMNGLDATREIRKKNSNIPVIAATANVFEDDRISCQQAGFTDFISKPINFTVLFQLLEKYLS